MKHTREYAENLAIETFKGKNALTEYVRDVAINFYMKAVEENNMIELREALEAVFPFIHDLYKENILDANAGIFPDKKIDEAFMKVKNALNK